MGSPTSDQAKNCCGCCKLVPFPEKLIAEFTGTPPCCIYNATVELVKDDSMTETNHWKADDFAPCGGATWTRLYCDPCTGSYVMTLQYGAACQGGGHLDRVSCDPFRLEGSIVVERVTMDTCNGCDQTVSVVVKLPS